LGSFPLPTPPNPHLLSANCLSFSGLPPVEITVGRREWGKEAKSYDGGKAWSSIIH
jgi:hypothetical protein